MSEPQVKARLGDRLLAKGLVDERQLQVALSEQKRAYRPLGEILVSLGFVREQDISRMLADDLGLAFVRAADIEPDPLVLSAVDREFVRSTNAFPIDMHEGVLRVAMSDPDDPEALSAVRSRFPYPLELSVTTAEDLADLVRQHLPEHAGHVAEIFEVIKEAREAFGDDFPVERIAQALLLDGIQRGATDIHIEPEEAVTRVRYRIDGILCQGENLPRDATEAIISRIKILSNLDIAERRRPQDGRLRVEIDERKVDMRVSMMPCADGENVVLRILDRGAVALKLAHLGIRPEDLAMLARIVERPHGLFLVTGPTGSGKTTTLYSMLGEIDAMVRNVATVEDPIEYRMPLVRQSQVDPSIGFDFNAGLRSLLRQDPDVILVGEIRDRETAEMAIKASMTGHLVFSTLHTNSALGAVPRLADLGIDPFLVEDSLIGALAQRLVRKNCRYCSKAVEPDERARRWLGEEVGTLKRGSGCPRCNDTGYSGRLALSELFLPDDGMADVLRAGTNLVELRRLAYEAGFIDMTEDGKAKVRAGLTSIAEIERVNKSHRLAADERIVSEVA